MHGYVSFFLLFTKTTKKLREFSAIKITHEK